MVRSAQIKVKQRVPRRYIDLIKHCLLNKNQRRVDYLDCGFQSKNMFLHMTLCDAAYKIYTTVVLCCTKHFLFI